MKARSLVVGLSLLLAVAIFLIRPAGRDQDSTGDRSAEQGVLSQSPEDEVERHAQAASDAPGDAGDRDPELAQRAEPGGDGPEAASDELLRELRDENIKLIRIDYSLMLKHLALTDSEYAGMLDFLAEDLMSKTYTTGHRPVPIGEADRRAGIAALIGEAKLERFLVLEQGRFEYREAQRIANMLEESGVPLSAESHDRLLDILIDVRERQQASGEPDVQSGTLEWVESMHARLDDYERLVLELSPSVLSAAQQELLYNRYHSLWMRRAAHLERQAQMRANDEDFPLGYLRRQ
ncbi:MAG: hypothetical protein AAFX10_10305 [Pseudomonadota bacterium]